jgi:hypothetical protein
MRLFVRVVAGFVIAISCISIFAGLVTTFNQTATEPQGSLLLGSGLGGVLLSGIAWILVDIANALAPEPTHASAPSRTPTQLSEMSDDDLAIVSHNTSRGLPQYKAIMEELNRRGKTV